MTSDRAYCPTAGRKSTLARRSVAIWQPCATRARRSCPPSTRSSPASLSIQLLPDLLWGRGGQHTSEQNQESNCGPEPSVRDFVHRELSHGGRVLACIPCRASARPT